MTPDALHYALVFSIWIAMPVLVVASALLHAWMRGRSSLALLVGLVAILAGQGLQLFSPIAELPYDEFRGIVVSSGELPLSWYAGSLVSSAALLVVAGGALGVVLVLRRSPGSDRVAA